MFSLKKKGHIFKSSNIYLKPERFRKSNFTLPKVKSNIVKFDIVKFDL